MVKAMIDWRASNLSRVVQMMLLVPDSLLLVAEAPSLGARGVETGIYSDCAG